MSQELKADPAKCNAKSSQTNDDWYRSLFHHSPNGILLVDPDTRMILAANPAACDMLGRTEAALCALKSSTLYDLGDPAVAKGGDEFARTSQFRGELSFQRADGTSFPVQVSNLMFPGPDGRPVAGVFFSDITEQKTATESLRESEEKWRGLFEFLPVGVSIVDTKEMVTDTNPALAEILCLSEEALLKGNYKRRRYFRPDHTVMPPAEFPSLRAVNESKMIRNVEVGVEKEDGEIIWTSVSATPLGSGGKSATVTVDITERKRAEEALAASQALYRLLAEHSSDAVSMIDPDGKVIYASPANVRRLGYDESDLLSLDTPGILQRIHPDDRAHIAAEIKRGREMKLPTTRYEYRVRTVRGDYIWLEDILRREFSKDGEFVRTIVNSRDITERKLAEEKLRASEERLREVLENSVDFAYKRNIQSNTYDYLSPVLTEIVGYTLDEFYSLPVETVMEFIHPDDRAAVERTIAETMASPTGTPHRVEYRFRHKDGHYVWLQDRSTAVMDADSNITARIGGITDVTERRRQQEEILRLNATLEQTVAERTAQLAAAVADLQRAGKMKDEFMAAISHELRTPLSGVLGMAEALEMQLGGPLNKRQLRYVAGIRQSGERLLSMVSSILRYAGLLGGSVKLMLEPCQLAELCAIAVRTARTRAEQKDQTLELSIESVGLTIVSDGDGIIQVLQQLLDNAVKFTPNGGQVGLKLREDCDGKRVHLIIWDTGIGISAEQQATILQPFVQGDASLARAYEGIGLGLAYVQRMVELLGGTLTLESTLGRGSRFTVTLPIQDTPVDMQEPRT